MNNKSIILLIFLFLSSPIIHAQITDAELGRGALSKTGLYDFSDPGAINIKVAIWGYVSRPGKYIVPDYTTVIDLISYAGGPYQSAEMDDLRLYRVLDDGKEEMIKFSYNDIIWEDNLTVKNRLMPKLQASDILIVPGSPKLFFQDWFNIGIQVFSVILSIVNLIMLINLYN